MARIASGRAPDPKLGAWSWVARTVWSTGFEAFRQRRARAA